VPPLLAASWRLENARRPRTSQPASISQRRRISQLPWCWSGARARGRPLWFQTSLRHRLRAPLAQKARLRTDKPASGQAGLPQDRRFTELHMFCTGTRTVRVMFAPGKALIWHATLNARLRGRPWIRFRASSSLTHLSWFEVGYFRTTICSGIGANPSNSAMNWSRWVNFFPGLLHPRSLRFYDDKVDSDQEVVNKEVSLCRWEGRTGQEERPREGWWWLASSALPRPPPRSHPSSLSLMYCPRA